MWQGRSFSELFRFEGLHAEFAGVHAEDHEADDDRSGEQVDAEDSGVEGGVAEQDTHKAEDGAGGAESKIEALAGVSGVAQKNQQNRGDDGVDREQDDAADDFVSVERKRLGVRQSCLESCHTEKEDRMDQGDDSALAAVEDGKGTHHESRQVCLTGRTGAVTKVTLGERSSPSGMRH